VHTHTQKEKKTTTKNKTAFGILRVKIVRENLHNKPRVTKYKYGYATFVSEQLFDTCFHIGKILQNMQLKCKNLYKDIHEYEAV
jgi:hypothetical protein